MKLERTLTVVWQLRGSDVPGLAAVKSRARESVVDDVEHLCAAIVVDVSRMDRALHPWVATETADLYEAVGFLLGRTVEVLDRYDPTRGRAKHDPWTAGFRAWLHDELRNDLIDHWRSWNGRHGHKRLPSLSNIDEDGETYDGVDGHDGRSTRERRLRGAADTDSGDRGDAGLDALRRRFLEGGDRALLREVEALGLGPDPGARGGVARPDRVDERDQLDLVKAA